MKLSAKKEFDLEKVFQHLLGELEMRYLMLKTPQKNSDCLLITVIAIFQKMEDYLHRTNLSTIQIWPFTHLMNHRWVF